MIVEAESAKTSRSLTLIEQVLAEPVETALDREQKAFSRELAVTDGTVVLFGAGRLGRMCARALQAGGIELRAFCDSNPELVGSAIADRPVLSVQHAAERFGTASLFVVSIWSGTASESTAERLLHLRMLGCRHVVPFPALLWAHGVAQLPFHSFDLPSLLLCHASELRSVAYALADEPSREAFMAELRRRLHGDYPPTQPSPNQYFPPDLVRWREDEVIVDAGAFTGDTLLAFLATNPDRRFLYHAFEPDPHSRHQMEELLKKLAPDVSSRVVIHPEALSESEGKIGFAACGGVTSKLDNDSALRVASCPLDSVFAGAPFTFLKIDVEGGEMASLRGAEVTLRREQPSTAVCVYHRPEDIGSLPSWLIEALPNHHFHFRMHGHDGWESVFYAIRPDHQP